jgi:hypothetical protein
MRRRSILLDESLDRRIERRARERGTTFTDAVREVLEKEFGDDEENPNQWLVDSIGVVDSGGTYPPIDSDEGRELLRRYMEARRTGRQG